MERGFLIGNILAPFGGRSTISKMLRSTVGRARTS